MLFEQTTLFRAGDGGYATYRIPGMVVTAKGTLLAYCEGRKTGRGDWGSIDIFLRRSTDGGRTWSEPQKIGRPPEPVPKNPVALQQNLAASDDQTFNNPLAIADHQSGVIHFLFCAEYAHCYYMRSADDGQTWTEAVDITAAFEAFRPEYNWRVLATGPGHGIRLQNGRLLVPVWLSTGTGGHAHRPSCVSVIYSDDAGQTWERGQIVLHHSEATPNPSETAAVQLIDGRVMLNIRSESKRQRRLVAFSPDGVTDWTSPAFDEALFEPICFGSLVRYDDDRILFVNPDSQNNSKSPTAWGAWPRENLTIRLSNDEGQTWPISKVIDPGIGGYADLAIGLGGVIFCLYEGGGVNGDMFHNRHLTLARFDMAWLIAN